MRANFADIYLRVMRVRRMRSGTELAREIQLTYWSTRGDQGKVVFVISANHHGGIYFPFHNGKNRLSIVPITHQLKIFTLRFLSRKNLGKELVLTNKSFFRNFNSIRGLRFARKPV